jgi:ABC-type cobalamin/Fe3+-siderophores transport system ATPase subunit
MRIISIEQSSAPINDGLADIKMRGLNHIVILAGANWSGKSRLLKRIQHRCNPDNQHNYWGDGYEIEFPQALTPMYFVSTTHLLVNPAEKTKDSIIQIAQQSATSG